MILCKAPTTESQREIINAINIFGTEGSLAFNESLLLQADGALDFDVLKVAVERLTKRHDSLRMTFSPDGTSLFVHDQLQAQLEYVDTASSSNSAIQLEVIRKQAVIKPFDIQGGPLLRLILVRESEHKSTIVIVYTI